MIRINEITASNDIGLENEHVPQNSLLDDESSLQYKASHVLIERLEPPDRVVLKSGTVEPDTTSPSSQDLFGLRSRRRSSAPAILGPGSHVHHGPVTFLPYSVQIPPFDAWDATESKRSSNSSGYRGDSGISATTEDGYQLVTDDFEIPVRLKRPSATNHIIRALPVPVLKHWKRIGWTAGHGMSEPTIQTSHLTITGSTSRAISPVHLTSPILQNSEIEQRHFFEGEGINNSKGAHISWHNPLPSVTPKEHIPRESQLLLVTSLKDQVGNEQQHTTVDLSSRQVSTNMRDWAWEGSSNAEVPSTSKLISRQSHERLTVSETIVCEDGLHMTENLDNTAHLGSREDGDATFSIGRSSIVESGTIPTQIWNISSNASDGTEDHRRLILGAHRRSNSWHASSDEEQLVDSLFPEQDLSDVNALSIPIALSNQRRPSNTPLVALQFRQHRDSLELYHRRMQRFNAGRLLPGTRILRTKQSPPADDLGDAQDMCAMEAKKD